ncbi:MAG: hypothetical protein H0V66_02940 [Bdellovibrionales bacterium]|nr:hypothetical protein [Bdellovibrionales bacterium]
MQKNETASPFIFYLSLEDTLPSTFYTFDKYFKELGFILVPVKIDQLQVLCASSEQEQVIVLCSVTNVREYKLYNEKIRKFLKFILKSKRLTFMHCSSFSKLNDYQQFVIQKNYYFIRYPLNAKLLTFKISKYHTLKKEQHTIWPGGRRATLSAGVV